MTNFIDKSEILLEIGKRLKSFRKKEGLRQSSFAQILGISQQALSNIERGQSGITETQLYILGTHFADFDANFLILGKKKEVETAPTEGIEKEL